MVQAVDRPAAQPAPTPDPAEAQAASSTTPRARAAKVRDPWFDNAKMTLVALVVVGHSWTLLPHNVWDDWTYDFLYSWHIPAFVIVTGYLSRSFEWTLPRLRNLVTTVAVPYILFEGLLVWFRHSFGGVTFEKVWANPHWPMWYLAALFFWRLMTPLFKRIPGKVVVAVAISVTAGMYATDLFDNARILGLLPFFVLGLKMHDGHWALLRTRRARWYGAAVLVGLFVLARFSGDWLSTEWLYYRSRYDTLDSSDTQAFVIRMCLLLVGLAGAFAFFAVVPRGRSWLSTLGGATLVVYLFHGFFVLTAEFSHVRTWTADHPIAGFVVITPLALALAVLLACKPVSSRLGHLVDPIGSISRRRRGRVPSSA